MSENNKELGRSHRARRRPQSAPSPLEGEGRGGGCLFDSAGFVPPSRLARRTREPTSPTRGEVTGASRQPFAIAVPHKGGGVWSTRRGPA